MVNKKIAKEGEKMGKQMATFVVKEKKGIATFKDLIKAWGLGGKYYITRYIKLKKPEEKKIFLQNLDKSYFKTKKKLEKAFYKKKLKEVM